MTWNLKNPFKLKEEQQKRRVKVSHPHYADHIKDPRKSVPYRERYYSLAEAPETKGIIDSKGNVVPMIEVEKSKPENEIPLTEDVPKIHKKNYEVNVESKRVKGFIRMVKQAFRELFQ